MAQKSVALFVDVNNLHFCINKKYDFKKKLCYKKFFEKIKEIGEIYRAIAYGCQLDSEAQDFISTLRKLGYDPKYRRPENDRPQYIDWNVGIAMDIVRHIDKVDIVVIASSNYNLAEVSNWIKDKGVKSVIFACGIPRELKKSCDQYIEIKDELLDDNKREIENDSREESKSV